MTECDEVKAAQADELSQLDGIAFVGNVLAPFFLEDPEHGAAQAAFEALAHLDVPAAAAQWPFVADDVAEASLARMVAGLSDCVDEAGAFAASEALVWEYRRLFVGPGKKPCPPWGSVYTDRQMVMFGLSTLELRAWMRAHGIVGAAGAGEGAGAGAGVSDGMPEDHIGLMLALMATLATEQPESLDEYLREHLLTWASHYLEQLETEARHPFYAGLALLTNASLEGIRRSRALTVAYPKFYR